MACQNDTGLEKKNTKILIIGNSITFHPPDNSIGWNADWGMAATIPGRDYVSLLTQLIRKREPDVAVTRENVYPFERNYDKFDWDTYSYLRALEVDLLIVRLGENVNEEKLGEDVFKTALQGFVNYLSGGRNIEVIVTTTFWENIPVTRQLIKAGEESGWKIVHLSDLGQEDRFMALGKFDNDAVSRHPNDLGMAEIAQRIWKAMGRLY